MNLKYDPSYAQRVTEMFRDGSSITKVAAVKLGITRDTYYKWKESYPEFKEAAELGEQISETIHEAKLESGADGEIDNYNAASRIFIMKSRFRKTYGEQKEINVTGIKSLAEQLIDTDDTK